MFSEGFSFPHPVLGLADDMTGEFKVDLKVGRDSASRALRFDVTFVEISNSYIKSLLDSGHASLIFKIYCSSTLKTLTIVSPSTTFEIDENDLVNRAEVEALIIAKNDIPSYQDSSFHSHFGNCVFTVNRYDVIGTTGKISLPIEKMNEKLGLGNIFKFMAKDPGEPITFGYNQDKIHIYYPIAESNEHPPNWIFKIVPWTGFSLFVIPALAGAFDFISVEGKEAAEGFEWFNVIQSMYPEDEREDDSYVNAQMLLRRMPPIIDSFEELKKKIP